MDSGNLSLWSACPAGGREECFAIKEEDRRGVGELSAVGLETGRDQFFNEIPEASIEARTTPNLSEHWSTANPRDRGSRGQIQTFKIGTLSWSTEKGTLCSYLRASPAVALK
jgi:hypothetical protein